MRYINLSRLNLPSNWEEKAEQAKSDVINNNAPVSKWSRVWSELKDSLADLSYDKCWYCEIVQERSDNAVDHFRPKSRYPWLAFSKENLRYSCTYCNSKRRNPVTNTVQGKGDEFPLLDESKRAKGPGDERSESPLLLDPTVPNDPGLLDFREDGVPCPKYSKSSHEIRYRRAVVSIKLYHLDHPDLIDKRKELAIRLIRKIERANALFDRVDQGDTVLDNVFNELIQDLFESISEKSELSAFARKVISGKREYEWIEALLEKS